MNRSQIIERMAEMLFDSFQKTNETIGWNDSSLPEAVKNKYRLMADRLYTEPPNTSS